MPAPGRTAYDRGALDIALHPIGAALGAHSVGPRTAPSIDLTPTAHYVSPLKRPGSRRSHPQPAELMRRDRVLIPEPPSGPAWPEPLSHWAPDHRVPFSVLCTGGVPPVH